MLFHFLKTRKFKKLLLKFNTCLAIVSEQRHFNHCQFLVWMSIVAKSKDIQMINKKLKLPELLNRHKYILFRELIHYEVLNINYLYYYFKTCIYTIFIINR